MKLKSVATGAIALGLVFCTAMPAFAASKKIGDITPVDPVDPTPGIGRPIGGRISKDKIKPLPVKPIHNDDGPIEIPVPDPHPGVPNLPS